MASPLSLPDEAGFHYDGWSGIAAGYGTARGRGIRAPRERWRLRSWLRLGGGALVVGVLWWLFMWDNYSAQSTYPQSGVSSMAGNRGLLRDDHTDTTVATEADMHLLQSYLLPWAFGDDADQEAARLMRPESDNAFECAWFAELYRSTLDAEFSDPRCVPAPPQPPEAGPVPAGQSREQLLRAKATLLDAEQQLTTAQLLALDAELLPKTALVQLDRFSQCPWLNGSWFFRTWNVTLTPARVAQLLEVAARAPAAQQIATASLATVLARAAQGGDPGATPSDGGGVSVHLDVATDAALVAQLVDLEARRLLERFERQFALPGSRFVFVEQATVARFACFMAAHGRNEFSQLIGGPSPHILAEFPSLAANLTAAAAVDVHVDALWGQKELEASSSGSLVTLPPEMLPSASAFPARRLLATLHPDAYFPALGFTTDALARLSGAETPEVKPRYELAYLLMLHGGLANTKLLIEAILDRDAFVLIHVDASAPRFKARLAGKLREWFPHPDRADAHVDNIRIMEASFDVLWGHITIVWAELLGFFQLLDLCDFEYVVNLSGNDYPLVSSENIRRHLRPLRGLVARDEHGFPYRVGVNFMYDVSSWQTLERVQFPVFMAAAPTSSGSTMMATWRQTRSLAVTLDRQFPLARKSSQWVILHRSLLAYMRKDARTRLLLAFMEHTMIPDEEFFSMYILSTPLFARDGRAPRRVSNFPKRLIYWGSNNFRHPRAFTWAADAALIQTDVLLQRNWFLRKVDISQQPEMRAWLAAHRQRHEHWHDFCPPVFYDALRSRGRGLVSVATVDAVAGMTPGDVDAALRPPPFPAGGSGEHRQQLDALFRDRERLSRAANVTLALMTMYLSNQMSRHYERVLRPV